MRIALDSNILVYVEGVNGATLQKVAAALVGKLSEDTTFVPVQVLGELFNVLVKKAKWSPPKARGAVFSWQDTFPLIETSSSVLLAATDLVVDHAISVWDAVILAAAAEAQCRLLLSEDMQDGFTWNGVTVANPFAAKKNELLRRILES